MDDMGVSERTKIVSQKGYRENFFLVILSTIWVLNMVLIFSENRFLDFAWA